MKHSWEPSEQKAKELALFIAEQSEDDPNFGVTKLFKLLFFSDFGGLRDLGHPITGVPYVKMKHGPVPQRADEYLLELEEEGAATLEVVTLSHARAYEQKRLKVHRVPELDLFTSDELQYVERVIREHWRRTAVEISNLSHDLPAWQVPRIGQLIPYHAIFYPDPRTPIPDDVQEWADQVAAEYAAKKKG